MLAQVLFEPNTPLILKQLPKPSAGPGELLVRVQVCGVCRTDLHIIEGDLPLLLSPLILGHQIVGIVEAIGENVKQIQVNDRIGISWLANTCKECRYCKEGKENLCDQALFTGYSVPGGFAEYVVCKEEYAIALPSTPTATLLAPLLCAGLIGFRAYSKAKEAQILGFYGFGSSAHILLQIAKQQGKQVFVFTRKGDVKGQEFAKKLGADWVGSTEENPPLKLDAALMFAPSGELIPKALQDCGKGGQCICVGIHMSDIPSLSYKDLFWEKSLSSVSNLTRKDARDFFSLFTKNTIEPQVTTYPLEKANEAIQDLKSGLIKGSCVLTIS